MQVKFESKTQRVKGLSFHAIRPWILVSLHNGLIQLWDYKVKTLIETFDAHDGPCRGINFHSTQPLFVSGGDDYLVKVWNYKQRKHLFTLKGHLDYIRTTEFHNELPWILSSSDDQTIRIWNYQSRSMLAILTGHSHYVMAAAFHPTKDLIVSCSLDQTLRLWDFSAIKNKSKRSSTSDHHEIYGTEVEVIAIMEGHDRGINYCAFHPTQNIILSTSDDRKVKLWKYTDSKAWEHDSLFGHNSNVSSGVFHGKLGMVITNSEDKTTRIWSLERRTQLEQIKKEVDRYWICNTHPENYLFATGHDSGFEIYSLISKKIPFNIIDANQLVISYRKQLKLYDFRNNSQYTLKNLEGDDDSLNSNNIISLQHNNFDTSKASFIIGLKQEDKKKQTQNRYMLLQYDGYNIRDSKESSKNFFGLNAVFVTKSKIARLKENKEVEVYNTELDTSSSALPGLQNVTNIFQSPIGKLMAITEDSVVLYDVNAKKSVQQIPLSGELANLKQVIWNKSNTFLAFVCKKQIHIYTKNFQKLCTFPEKFNIKSLIWSKDNTILYSTVNHIKYGLLNGDSGILRCTDATLRIVQFNQNKSEITAIDTQAKVINMKLNCEEYILKSALQEKNWEKTQNVLGSMQKLGNSVVSYLYKKNYAGLALELVNDTRAQFSLALDSGNLEVAFKAAQELKDKELYKQFAKEALRQGQTQIYENNPNVEMAYRQTKEYEKLQFLYLITGQQQKLQLVNQIHQKRGDIQSRFQNSLYTGDIEERIKVLSEIGQLKLAYLTAVSHGYSDMANLLRNSIENPEELLQELSDISQLNDLTAMVPPQPLVRNVKTSQQAQRNWPLNFIPQEYMIAHKSSQDEKLQELVDEQQVNTLLVEDEPQIQQDDEEPQQQTQNINFEIEDEGQDGWVVPDDDLPPEQEEEEVQQHKQKEKTKTTKQDIYKRQENPIIRAGKLSQLIGEQTAVGYFEQAFQTMKKQLGIVNYEPLKEVAMKVQAYSQVCVPQIPFLQSQMNQISSDNNKPYVYITLNTLSTMVTQKAYKLFSKGPPKFKETHDTFTEILHSIPFIHLKSEDEVKIIHSLIKICLEYIIAIRLQLQAKKEPQRASELLSYMALCNLQTPHREITLRQAQSTLYKQGNYIYTSFFAKKLIRLFENSEKQDVVKAAKRMLGECEKNGSNSTKIVLDEGWLYDDEFIYSLDASSYTVIDGNSTKCPFCSARYNKDKEGSICNICRVARVGQEVLGLKYQP